MFNYRIKNLTWGSCTSSKAIQNGIRDLGVLNFMLEDVSLFSLSCSLPLLLILGNASYPSSFNCDNTLISIGFLGEAFNTTP